MDPDSIIICGETLSFLILQIVQSTDRTEVGLKLITEFINVNKQARQVLLREGCVEVLSDLARHIAQEYLKRKNDQEPVEDLEIIIEAMLAAMLMFGSDNEVAASGFLKTELYKDMISLLDADANLTIKIRCCQILR